jgi:hypothetical protein
MRNGIVPALCIVWVWWTPGLARPINDDFQNRLPLEGMAGEVGGTNRGGSRQTGEPLPEGISVAASSWWSWKAPASGLTTVYTLGSEFDTVLAVYTGSAVGSLRLVAANDDNPRFVQPFHRNSLLSFLAEEGTEYQIMVASAGAETGGIRLSWQLNSFWSGAPPNNRFADRILLEGEGGRIFASNRGAVAENAEPQHAPRSSGVSVWWRWSPPHAGRARFATHGSSIDTILAVYTGTALASLSRVASNDNAGPLLTSEVEFDARPGRTYHIAVDAAAGDTGVIILSWGMLSTLEWERRFGTPGVDRGLGFDQLAGGGFVVSGSTYLPGALPEIYLARTDAEGMVLWQKSFGPPAGECPQVLATPDGGFLLAGFRLDPANRADGFLLKSDGDGGELWSRRLGGGGIDQLFDIARANDGGFFVAGYKEIQGSRQLYVVKVDSDGEMLWEREAGGAGIEIAWGVLATSDGGAVAVGESSSFGSGDTDVYLVRLDAGGAVLFEKNYGSTSNEVGLGVAELDDGGFLIGGAVEAPSSIVALLLRTDARGGLLWERRYPGVAQTFASHPLETADGAFLITGRAEVAGASEPDLLLIKVDVQGSVLARETFGGPGFESGQRILPQADGGLVIGGLTSSPGGPGEDDIYLIKLAGPSGKEPTEARFRRGDVDQNGQLNLTDAVFTLDYLFRSGEAPLCARSADTDGNGAVNVTDAIALLLHLFRGGPPPAEPFAACGLDPSPGALSCNSFEGCR